MNNGKHLCYGLRGDQKPKLKPYTSFLCSCCGGNYAIELPDDKERYDSNKVIFIEKRRIVLDNIIEKVECYNCDQIFNNRTEFVKHNCKFLSEKFKTSTKNLAFTQLLELIDEIDDKFLKTNMLVKLNEVLESLKIK